MKTPRDFDRLLTSGERRLVASLTTPPKIQEFLDSIDYSEEERYRSPLTVLRDRKGHCFDGALFAAAMLRRIGYPPIITDIIPNDNDDDHLLALFKMRGHWGAVAKSNYSGLRFREPVYRTLRELVMSYFENFFNSVGEKTMRGYTRPLDLTSFDASGWMTDDNALDAIGQRLDEIRTFKPISPAMIRNLSFADDRSLRAGLLGAKAEGLFKVQKRAR
ncbi:MAG TPA: transglutaminase domain-containing protein [Bacteroidota bacterium]|nr:transglutaminase domain-containing protein [Bacteroidota bacterium]